MTRVTGVLFAIGVALFSSCSKKEEAAKPATETTQPAQTASGPHAVVTLKDGTKVPGSIVASSQTDMVVAGDNGVESTIPLAQVKSVDYGESPNVAANQEKPQPVTQQP